MPIQITDAGANLKINVDGNARLVAKSSVKSIRIVAATYIKLNAESCCAPWDYLAFSEITQPVAATITEMRDAIGTMLLGVSPSTPSAAGLAIEAKQSEAIGKLNEIKSTIETGFTGKATEALQGNQYAVLQSIYTLLGAMQTTITDAAAVQATIAKQNETLSALASLSGQINAVQLLLGSILEEQLFLQAPSRSEDVSDSLRYEGFALPGALDSAPVWAIRKWTISPTSFTIATWAGGSKLRSQVWNNRAALIYM